VPPCIKKIWQKTGDGRPFKYETRGVKNITANKREIDPTKIEELGWSPEVSIDEGIERTAAWMSDQD